MSTIKSRGTRVGDERMGIWQQLIGYFGFSEPEQDEYHAEDGDYEQPVGQPTVRKLGGRPASRDRTNTSSLRTVSVQPMKVHVVEPDSYNEAIQIGEKFKSNIPVIMNLQKTELEASKRLLDFATGLTYALDGGMQKIAEKVFLLTPSSVEVSPEEKRRWRDKGFFRDI